MFWPARSQSALRTLKRGHLALRRVLGALAPQTLLALLLPAASMLLADVARDVYLMALEALIAGGCIAHLLWNKNNKLVFTRRSLTWAVLMAGLGGADLAYNWADPLAPRYPRNHLPDMMLLLVVLGLTVMACRGWRRRHGPWSIAALTVMAMGVLQLQVVFVLQPLMQQRGVPHWAMVNAWCYAAACSVLWAMLLSRSSRAVLQEEHLAAQGLLLMLASDFAQREDALSASYAMGWGEAGWAAGMGLLAVALCCGSAGLPWRASSPHAPWRSARCTLGGLTFAGNAVLLCGAMLGGLLQITEGAELTSLLWLIWVGWFVSNTLAVRLHEAMGRIASVMPAPHITWCQDFHPAKVALRPISPRIHLAEFDSWVARYNQLVRQLNPLIAQVSRHQEAFAYQQLAEHVAHDIRAPIAALDSALDALGDREASSTQILRQAALRIREVAQTLLGARRHLAHHHALAPSLPLPAPEHACDHAVDEMTPLLRAFELAQRDLVLRHGQQRAAEVNFEGNEVHVAAPLTALLTVLGNLIDNSLEATPANQVPVRVTVSETANGWLTVAVSDRGEGMPAAILHALGRRSVISGKRDGNGLGVLSAAQAVQSWGGTLRHRVLPHGGTEATFTVAVVAPETSAEDTVLLHKGDVLTTAVLVDDDPLVRAAWRLSANSAQVHLEVFASAEACLQALGRLSTACTFYLDTQLGGELTGHGLARLLLAKGFRSVVVMQSAGGGGSQIDVSDQKQQEHYQIVASKRAPFAATTKAA